MQNDSAAETGSDRERLLRLVAGARTLTHDINNRLVVVMGRLDLLAENRDLPPSGQELLAAALAELDALARDVHAFQAAGKSDLSDLW